MLRNKENEINKYEIKNLGKKSGINNTDVR